MNSFGSEREELLSTHSTPKNKGLIADAICDVTHRGDIVLDGFLGSGTTLVACERTGRACRGIEIDPLYVDSIVRRWERISGRAATLIGSGRSFAEVTTERLSPVASLPTRRSDTSNIVVRARKRVLV